MTKNTTIVAMLALVAGISMISPVYAFEDNDFDTKFDLVMSPGFDGVHVDSSIVDFVHVGGALHNFDDNGKFVAIDLVKVADMFDFEAAYAFLTTGNIQIELEDPNEHILEGQLDFTIVDEDTAIISYEDWVKLFTIQGKSENGAPSLSGFNTRDADRVHFEGVEKQPTFVMSNTEIHVLAGQATQQFVPVYFDGILIDIIDNGRSPSGAIRDTTIGFGGAIIDVPFGAYYEVTNEGQLINHGAGYQNVFRDLSDYAQFNEDKTSADPSGSSAAYRIYQELYGQN